ncbi:hypothetical protein [Proteiniclasticum ruminis]|uniref:Uncharacterized protein n=1 Tax=Proteiniclasticum ruminis TaxID=398199 RepID=A0A1I4XW61_9CLOT|nr:hypothetical protein [Proteiniclasticum ruminis]SFN30151.1 hypothetical protein SAMN04488695_101234 [Proteiniclasticum ruminis]
MRNHKKPHSSSFNPILDEYKENEKKIMENECITGSSYEERAEKTVSGFRRNRTLYLLTQLMFILGILIALILWITRE